MAESERRSTGGRAEKYGRADEKLRVSNRLH